jgi:hypothetical protein
MMCAAERTTYDVCSGKDEFIVVTMIGPTTVW